MFIHGMESADRLIKSRVRRAKKRKAKNLSAASIFRMLRANTTFEIYGDYPLLASAVMGVRRAKFPVRRDTLFRIFRQSDMADLSQKERVALVDDLLSSQVSPDTSEA